MSSNRGAYPCEATVNRGEHAIGPVRLPMKAPNRFVEEFNLKYGKLGLAIEPISGAVIRREPVDEEPA
ncbi:MAG: hypothetical protein HKN47_14535 [Pirellulaceae bacterium]|nr:hypothetical protein [Pirellulaceae bacterium]